MPQLWIKVMNKQRISRQTTCDCTFDNVKDVLNDACKELDLPCPIWLGKQEREFTNFRITAFTEDNFVESIDFSRLAIEYIEDKDQKRSSRDPRNAFDY